MKESKPKFEIFDPIDEISKKFDRYMKFVFGTLVVAVVTLVFMVATLLLDAFHFNAATYKEYSKKTDAIELLDKFNKQQLEENKKSQQIIIDQQKQIVELLKKK